MVPTTTAHSGLTPPSYHPCRAHFKDGFPEFLEAYFDANLNLSQYLFQIAN
ncbi:hypothetical protein Nizo2262_0598 [Lactiplantibacillus plantarum]|nr:hypothetical protein Nizo2262_0598 [Lactiplantibacillus plantarum]